MHIKNPTGAGISVKIPVAVYRPEEVLCTGIHPEPQQNNFKHKDLIKREKEATVNCFHLLKQWGYRCQLHLTNLELLTGNTP